MTKKQKITYYILLVIISVNFLAAALPKVLGASIEIQGFASVGLPVWFVYVIGIGEILGVIGLWIKPLFRYAYEGLFLVLIGAFFTTLISMGFAPAILPLITAAILGEVVYLNSKCTSSK